jgi:hypothetical protein
VYTYAVPTNCFLSYLLLNSLLLSKDKTVNYQSSKKNIPLNYLKSSSSTLFKMKLSVALIVAAIGLSNSAAFVPCNPFLHSHSISPTSLTNAANSRADGHAQGNTWGHGTHQLPSYKANDHDHGNGLDKARSHRNNFGQLNDDTSACADSLSLGRLS